MVLVLTGVGQDIVRRPELHSGVCTQLHMRIPLTECEMRRIKKEGGGSRRRGEDREGGERIEKEGKGPRKKEKRRECLL